MRTIATMADQRTSGCVISPPKDKTGAAAALTARARETPRPAWGRLLRAAAEPVVEIFGARLELLEREDAVAVGVELLEALGGQRVAHHLALVRVELAVLVGVESGQHLLAPRGALGLEVGAHRRALGVVELAVMVGVVLLEDLGAHAFRRAAVVALREGHHAAAGERGDEDRNGSHVLREMHLVLLVCESMLLADRFSNGRAGAELRGIAGGPRSPTDAFGE